MKTLLEEYPVTCLLWLIALLATAVLLSPHIGGWLP